MLLIVLFILLFLRRDLVLLLKERFWRLIITYINCARIATLMRTFEGRVSLQSAHRLLLSSALGGLSKVGLGARHRHLMAPVGVQRGGRSSI